MQANESLRRVIDGVDGVGVVVDGPSTGLLVYWLEPNPKNPL